jgi:tRNA modification GTPase
MALGSLIEAPRVALLTPMGRGALAVVGVCGPGATALVDRFFAPRRRRPPPTDQAAIGVGRWQGHAGGVDEDVVVVWRADDRLEVHCHGGLAASQSVLVSLEAAGATRVPWAWWYAAGGEPDWAVAAREALAVAGGPKAARILARQLAGAWIAEWRSLTAEAAAGACEAVGTRAHRLLAAARIGLRLTRPWRVVVAGPVNAGKSSLVNALAGHARCIVTPTPGTTRDLVETRLVLAGWEVDVVDTAGTREPGMEIGAVELAGIERATVEALAADLVVRVVPADGFHGPSAHGPRELLVVTKCDLRDTSRPPPAWLGCHVATSAETGRGIESLAAAIVRRLVPEEHDAPGLLDGGVPFTADQVEAVRRVRDAITS